MTITNFVWNDLSDNVLMETDENNVPVAKYTNEPGQFGEVLSQHRHGQDHYFHFDGLGSTRNLTGQNQTVSDIYTYTDTYTAFGETVASSGSTPNPFKYNGAVGYYTSDETSDLYVRARFYDPQTGDFISHDPLEYVDGMSLYRGYFVPNTIDPGGKSNVNLPQQNQTDKNGQLMGRFQVVTGDCESQMEGYGTCCCRRFEVTYSPTPTERATYKKISLDAVVLVVRFRNCCRDVGTEWVCYRTLNFTYCTLGESFAVLDFRADATRRGG